MADDPQTPAKPPKPQPEGQTSGELAQLFDCTPRQVELLAKEGIVVRVGRGRYNAALSVRNYIRHLREQAAGRAGVDPNTDTASANRERALAQAALSQIKHQQIAGQLVRVSDVREVWDGIVRGVKQLVMSLPGKIAFEVPTLSVHDRQTIERVCRDGLEDAAMGRGFDLKNSGDGSSSTRQAAIPA